MTEGACIMASYVSCLRYRTIKAGRQRVKE